MKTISKWLSRGAEFIAAGMLAAMFVIFLLQIATRYASKIASSIPIESVSTWLAGVEPLRWTVEMLLILWLWIVFFGNAFIVRERDHVTFDIVYLAAPRRVRQVLGLISAAAMVVAMAWAVWPTWDYIDWMKMRKTATVQWPFTGEKIPMRTIFSVYALFMIAVILRYAWRFVDILRHGPPDKDHELVSHEDGGTAIQHGDEAT